MKQDKPISSELPTSPAMVFTLEDDQPQAAAEDSRSEEWATAPHDWEEPEEVAEAPTDSSADTAEPAAEGVAEQASPTADETAAQQDTAANEEAAAEPAKDILAEALAAFRLPENLSEPVPESDADDKPAAAESEQTETAADDVAGTDVAAEDAGEFRLPDADEPIVEKAVSESAPEPEFRLPDSDDEAADAGSRVSERNTLTEDGVSAAEERLLAYRAAVAETKDEDAVSQTDEAADSPAEPEQPPAPPASEEEAAYAHARFLRHTVAEHNATVFSGGLDGDSSETPEEDAAVLIQEDWIAAQEALRRERGDDDYLLPVQTVKLASTHLQGEQGEVPQRDITVHVYDVSDLPVGRKVRVVSEAALLADIRDKLRPHLSNAVAGLAARIVQKKTALLSYELQMMLNEEVPEVVEEILSHNLAEIFQAVKDAQK